MRTPRLRLNLATICGISFTVAIARSAATQPVPDASGSATAGPYTVSLSGFFVHAPHHFAVGSGFITQSEAPGTFVCFQLQLDESAPRHIVSRTPSVRFRRVLDGQGRDVLPFAAVRDDRGNYPLRAGAFVLPLEPSDSGARPTVSIPLNTVLYLRALPPSLSRLEADIAFEEVTEDFWCELALPAGQTVGELFPGVTFWIGDQPPAGAPSATERDDQLAGGYATVPSGLSAGYFFDPAAIRRPDGTVPRINVVRAVIDGRPQALNLHPTRTDGGLVAARCDSCIARPNQGSTFIEAHAVLATRPVTIPLRVENLSIAGPLADPDGPTTLVRPPVSRLYIAESDGFEVRLTQTLCRGGPSRTTSAIPPDLTATFELGVRDVSGRRSVSRDARWTLTDLLDEHGRPVANPAAITVSTDLRAAYYKHTRFYPTDELRVNDRQYEYAQRDARTATMGRLTVPMRSLPAHLGTLRGHVDVQAIKRDVIVTVPLDPTETPVEAAPGVHVSVRRKSDAADHRIPAGVPYSEVVIDVAHTNDPTLEPLPIVNVIQPLAGDGTPLASIDQSHAERTARGLRITLGYPLWSISAASLRLQIVLETTQQRIPFEFYDIPLASP